MRAISAREPVQIKAGKSWYKLLYWRYFGSSEFARLRHLRNALNFMSN
jgi:hypothetical protein